jgi:hypothetical protein
MTMADRPDINDGKEPEWQRGLAGFLLGLALGALVALLSKRKPE